MSYSTHPFAPLARRFAAELVRYRGLSRAEAARRVGFHPSTVGRWVKRAETLRGRKRQSTRSSRPHRPGAPINLDLEARIIQLRLATHHCAPVLSNLLAREGVVVSAAAIGRVLRQHGLVRPRPRSEAAPPAGRPRRAKRPGEVVQMDTLRLKRAGKHTVVVVTLVDEASRFAFAQVVPRGGPTATLKVLVASQQALPFRLCSVKVDHGRDFGPPFAEGAQRAGIELRRSRPGHPNDNALVERLHLTLRAECLSAWRQTKPTLAASVTAYLSYYNHQRPHLGLGCATPAEQLAGLAMKASEFPARARSRRAAR